MSQQTEKIGFVVNGREVAANGVIGIAISFVSSTKTDAGKARAGQGRLGANELPYILNMLRRSNLTDPNSHVGFDYTLDDIDGIEGGFPMTEGFGFPYSFADHGEESGFQIIDTKPSIT